MTTLARTRDVGFSRIRRGNSISVIELRMKTLTDRLRSGYEGVAVYAPYRASIEALYDAVASALAPESSLDLVARIRVAHALQHAEDLLTNRPYGVPAPTVDVWDNGRIAFEWFIRRDRIVTATIDEFGRIAYAGMDGAARGSEFVPVQAEWPASLVDWIDRIRE